MVQYKKALMEGVIAMLDKKPEPMHENKPQLEVYLMDKLDRALVNVAKGNTQPIENFISTIQKKHGLKNL